MKKLYLESFMLSIAYLFVAIACGITSFDAHAEAQKTYVGHFPFLPLVIQVTNDAKLKQAHHEGSNTLLKGMTLNERLALLNACSLHKYSAAMEGHIAAVQTIKRVHVDVWAKHVSRVEIPIDDKVLTLEGPLQQPEKILVFKTLVGNHFNEVGYRQLYQTTVKESNPEQSLLIKPLLTPDAFKKAMQSMIQDSNTGSYHDIELPERYAAPQVSHIQEQLKPHINAITTEQKIAVLHLCDMAARDALTPIRKKYLDLIAAEMNVSPDTISTSADDKTVCIFLGYDELYEDTQQIVGKSGTPEQKALFNFQATPEALGALFQQ